MVLKCPRGREGRSAPPRQRGPGRDGRRTAADDALAKLVDAAETVRHLKLEDLGPAVVGGRPCRRVRSWDLRLVGGTFLTPRRDWYFDDATHLPARVESTSFGAGYSVTTLDFRYGGLNKPLPDTLFRPGRDPGVAEIPADPLDEKYTRRFLNVIDGSDGRMSPAGAARGRAGPAAAA